MGAGGAELHAAADASKDQSYFLFATTREQLDFLRFPLGGLNKTETRALAERFALPVASKPDSQDICFVPDGDYASVVARLRPHAVQAGDIVDTHGRILGRHEGIIHFTVGQRRGLNLSGREGENNEPLYVLRVNAAERQVIVGSKEALARREVRLRELNWLDATLPTAPLEVRVKLRSAQPALPAEFRVEGAEGVLTLFDPAYGVAPGQAGVLYQGDRVLGGGWIAT